jgi:hypothetical protein
LGLKTGKINVMALYENFIILCFPEVFSDAGYYGSHDSSTMGIGYEIQFVCAA